MWKIDPNTNTSIIICAYKPTQNMFPKGLLEEMKGGGKEKKNDRQ
jgi:hypothetical protein